ncbi:uncharacterized protein UV8b_03702 [Ustilaginoidea virens]|uniref:Uncharacterized protein n=1 Tax=Ustilaginoidea virens TaxID=1159556 RepID=A0A8E5MHA5_USTVR|nr:uncharacterized protein UV8b_03702 [Ustilaginoidea virens]QUC19461.1 hypothetical protein UV8b_03702 [Ustilaginoidea virens]
MEACHRASMLPPLGTTCGSHSKSGLVGFDIATQILSMVRTFQRSDGQFIRRETRELGDPRDPRAHTFLWEPLVPCFLTLPFSQMETISNM